MAKEKKARVRRDPTLLESTIAMLAMMVMVSYVIMAGKGDAQMPFIAATAIAAIIALRTGMTWAELEAGIVNTISAALQSLIVIMVIGMVIGSWIQGGVVPAMIYYGLKIINPKFFLLTINIICMITGLSTGSTYTTAGTMGIAAMGMGSVLGIPPGMTAGAVICGAYFGDKMSPLSDTTCLASGVNKVNIFVHVRHMVWTVTPSVLFSWVMFTVLGLRYAPTSTLEMGAIDAMLDGIAGSFQLSPWLLLPMALVVLMIIFQVPALPGILGVSVLGAVCSIIQGHGLADIIDALHYGYVSETGIEAVDTLLTRGGMDSMMWTVSFIICVLAFGGIMDVSGMLRTIINAILKRVRRDGTVYLCAALPAAEHRGRRQLCGHRDDCQNVPQALCRAGHDDAEPLPDLRRRGLHHIAPGALEHLCHHHDRLSWRGAAGLRALLLPQLVLRDFLHHLRLHGLHHCPQGPG